MTTVQPLVVCACGLQSAARDACGTVLHVTRMRDARQSVAPHG